VANDDQSSQIVNMLRRNLLRDSRLRDLEEKRHSDE
jgi:hypothetical protein